MVMATRMRAPGWHASVRWRSTRLPERAQAPRCKSVRPPTGHVMCLQIILGQHRLPHPTSPTKRFQLASTLSLALPSVRGPCTAEALN